MWRPVPPSSAFVAMGMVITTTEEPPSQDSVRCVPRRWVVESTFKPVKVCRGWLLSTYFVECLWSSRLLAVLSETVCESFLPPVCCVLLYVVLSTNLFFSASLHRQFD